jgi:Trypsin-like peptidase domain
MSRSIRLRPWLVPALAIFLLSLAPSSVSAQSIGSYVPPAETGKRSEDPPPRLAEVGAIESPLVLPPASEAAREQLEAMEARNRAGQEPRQVGFSRRLPDAVAARISGDSLVTSSDPHSIQMRSATGTSFWGTRVTIRGAGGVRLHLTDVHLPPGTKLWSYGTEGNPVAFGLELLGPGGDLWAPMTFGETSYLDVEVPPTGSAGGFSIVEAAEIRPLAASTEPPCATDAVCVAPATFSPIGEAMSAVAVLIFQINSTMFGQCTGTLLNDTAQDGVPYLLTANHCISTQDEATSLTAYWDYHAPTCGGTVPSLGSVPTSSGATLLANSSRSDFSFLRLNAVPPGRAYMGWNSSSSAVPKGTTLFRVSCPASTTDTDTVLQQQWSDYATPLPTSGCLGTTFINSIKTSGYAFEGSSGSATMLSSGEVVGQLYGTCANITDPCTQPDNTIDGAFSVSYPSVAQWLSPTNQSCVPNMATLCLGARFQVTAVWQKPDGTSGPGTAVPLTADTGYFWFFDPSNVEVVTKVLDGCGIDNHYWVFSSGLTNVGVTLTYTDTAAGARKSYSNAVGAAFEPVQDTSAFATCP